MNIEDALARLVARLVSDGRVSLAAGASAEALAADLRARIAEAPAFSQLGPALSAALMSSPLVDELFASDAEIVETLTDLGR